MSTKISSFNFFKKPYTPKNKLIFFIVLFILNTILIISSLTYIYHNNQYDVTIFKTNKDNINRINSINQNFKIKLPEDAIKLDPLDLFKDYDESTILKNHKDFIPDELLSSLKYFDSGYSIYYDQNNDSLFFLNKEKDIVHYSKKTNNEDYSNIIDMFITYGNKSPNKSSETKFYIQNKEMNNYIFISEEKLDNKSKQNYFELSFFNEPLHSSFNKNLKLYLLLSSFIIDKDRYNSFLNELLNNQAYNKQIRYYKNNKDEIYKIYTTAKYSNSSIIDYNSLKTEFAIKIIFLYTLYSYTLLIIFIIAHIISTIRNRK